MHTVPIAFRSCDNEDTFEKESKFRKCQLETQENSQHILFTALCSLIFKKIRFLNKLKLVRLAPFLEQAFKINR